MAKDYESSLRFVTEEKSRIEDATFEIRDQLKRARRNYEGKYDNPYDKATGKRKIFIHLTKQEVDTVAPRFTLPENALQVNTNDPGNERKALLWQELLRFQFREMDWNNRLRAMMTQFVNDGTLVVEMIWDEEYKRPDVFFHDLKDIYIFPKEPSLQEASAFAVRKRISYADFKNNDRYSNKEDVGGSTVIDDTSRNDANGTLEYEIGKQQYETEIEHVDLYERHGFFPKSFLSGNEEDTELIDGTITIADIDGNARVVEISEENTRKNFIEAWYIRRPYLWYGMGLGIALRDYQFYYNKLVNRRDNNEDVLHYGMFVKRRGMNIEARQRVTGSGIWLEADNPSEITQLRTQDITQTSYVGERNLLAQVQRLDGTVDTIRGIENSASASEAAINNRNSSTRFELPQEFLNRLFSLAASVVMEMDKKMLPKKKVIKISGRDEELAMFDDFKLNLVNETRKEDGLPPISDAEFSQAMAKFKGERFVEFPNMKFMSGDFEIIIDTDASLIKNKAGLAQTLLDGMQVAAQIPGVSDKIDFSDLFARWTELQGMKVKLIQAKPIAQGQLPGGIQRSTKQSQEQVPQPSAKIVT